MMKRVLTAVSIIFAMTSVQAKELKGVSFPDEVKVGTTTLKLNGLGARKVYSIIDVYVGALYLAQPSKNADAIIKSQTPKRMVLHFVRWVPKDKMQDAWKEGFEKNAESGYSYRSDLNKLNDTMAHMKAGDEMTFTIYPDHLDVQMKNGPVTTLQGEQLARTLLKVFIKDPPDEDLKKGILNL